MGPKKTYWHPNWNRHFTTGQKQKPGKNPGFLTNQTTEYNQQIESSIKTLFHSKLHSKKKSYVLTVPYKKKAR
jgi:hypothetical protein